MSPPLSFIRGSPPKSVSGQDGDVTHNKSRVTYHESRSTSVAPNANINHKCCNTNQQKQEEANL